LLIWDFDGTLGFRAGGTWASALAEAAGKDVPPMRVSDEAFVPHLQSGFPWHHPHRPHPEIQSGEAWWEALYPILESAFRSVGADLDQA
jgi:putative hydrolase of the HAD superfamily